MALRQEDGLTRQLGLFPLTNIVIANMVGAGIFTTSGLLMGDLHHPLLMIALWILAGVISLCGALCYGEIGAAMPRAGGEYTFLSRLFHPAVGFMSGWVSFFAGFSAPIALSAMGFSEYLTRAFPELLHVGVTDAGVESWVLKRLYAVLVILAFTWIHMRGIVIGARVQNVLTVMKVGLIAALIAFGFASGRGAAEHFTAGGFDFGFSGWKTIGLSLMWIMFAYSGWNAAAYIGSEIKNPARNLPRSLLMGTGIVAALYVAFNLFYVYAVPPGEMEGVISIAGLAAGKLFGRSFEVVISILISFALFSSLSAFIILGPRVYYAMARDGLFFDFAASVHPTRRVPDKSILLQGVLASALVLLGTFDQILTYMGFSLGIFPILVAAGVFKVRRSGESAYRMPGYPAAPIVYIVFGAGILILAFLERPGVSSIAIAAAALGIPAYCAFRKRRRTAQRTARITPIKG